MPPASGMAEAQLQQFLDKVRQLNAFVALSEADPHLRQALTACGSHAQVVSLARSHGFDIGRRWGESEPPAPGEANLLAGPCPSPGEERLEVLLQGGGFRLERIHSCATRSPEGFWYEQAEHEWVLVLQGSALLRFDDGTGDCGLNRGDSLLISAGRRHRVEATDPDPGTVWLALFWAPERSGCAAG
jgi:cupin 2 domain-containing protein